MSFEYSFQCPLANGLHARPASLLQEVTSRFDSRIDLINERTGYKADAKSVLSLMSADLQHNDPCRLLIEGRDEVEAERVVVAYLRDEFSKSDEALPQVETPPSQQILPRALPLSAGQYSTGKCISRGMGRGQVVRLEKWSPSRKILDEKPRQPEDEMARFHQAAMACSRDLTAEIAAHAQGAQKEVLKAHLGILKDPSLGQKVEEFLAIPGHAVGRAIDAAAQFFSANLERSENQYLRERALDLQDVARRLIEQIYGVQTDSKLEPLAGPSIIFAQSLTPSQFLGLDRKWLQGLVLSETGSTSHTAILARTFGIPTLAEITPAFSASPKQEVILDADLGLLITEITSATHRYYQRKSQRYARAQAAAKAAGKLPSLTRDKHPFPLLANIATALEIEAALEQGAEGVGLFRTEMLFMDRAAAPSEDEQFEIYSMAAKASAGKPVTIRTLDIGGDKPVAYLRLPQEPNPFLGYRGVRLYRDFAELIKTQLRAILRASAHGQIKIMFPMVSSPEEARETLALLKEAETELRNRNALPEAKVEIGLMLEVPSMVFCLKELCRDFSFFSVGSNDLLQYFFAVDRENARVAPLASPFAPSLWRLLKQAADEIHAHGRSIGLCGEIGGRPELLSLLVGLQFDSVSMSAPNIAAAKQELGKLERPATRQLIETVTACADRAAVEAALDQFSHGSRNLSLLDPALVSIGAEAETKEEAIEDLTDLLGQSGRVKSLQLVEEAIWQREAVYSTGMEYGFAIPHCKSDAVLANSIAFMQLKKPISWDGEKMVQNVVLLAIRASDQAKEHLRILAQLSRLMMREPFREALSGAKDSDALIEILSRELKINP